MFGTGQNRNLEQKQDHLFHRNECMVDRRFIPYPRHRAGEWLISAIWAWTS
jgi:hypothetical protein